MLINRAVFLDIASLHPQDLDLDILSSTLPQWQWRDDTVADDVASVLSDVDVVVTNKVALPAPLLAEATQVKLICVAATGVNNIDIDAARAFDIPVCNVRAYATPAVVQHVFVLLLSLLTNITRYRDDVRSGAWSSSPFFCLLDHPIEELQGLTLGIIGYGELGRAVTQVAECFGMTVLIAKRDLSDERPGRIALNEMLPQLDVLSLHCPLTEATHNLIGEDELALMKESAVLINTARGGLVDESALLHALESKTIAAAALDVLAHEPPAIDNPMLGYHADSLIITPHVAWASRQSRQRLVNEVAENILAFQKGRPRNIV